MSDWGVEWNFAGVLITCRTTGSTELFRDTDAGRGVVDSLDCWLLGRDPNAKVVVRYICLF